MPTTFSGSMPSKFTSGQWRQIGMVPLCDSYYCDSDYHDRSDKRSNHCRWGKCKPASGSKRDAFTDCHDTEHELLCHSRRWQACPWNLRFGQWRSGTTLGQHRSIHSDRRMEHATGNVPVALASGTYWLAYFPSDSGLSFLFANTGQWYADPKTFSGSLPNAFAPGAVSAGNWSLYASLAPGGTPATSPTPGPTPTPTPVASGLKVFGSAIAGNINWNWSGLPIQTDFMAVQGDGFAWWSDMEPSQGNFSFGPALAMYNYAKSHNMKVRIFLGGGTSPGWVGGLDPNTAEAAWEKFLAALAAIMPQIDCLNLGNEPISTHAWSFANASKLGGNGSTGWDWAINAGKIVKKYFPNTMCGWNQWGCDVPGETAFSNYLALNKACAAAGAIDFIGLEAYMGNWGPTTAALPSNRFTQGQIASGLQAYHAACPNVPIYITELSVCDTNDAGQLGLMQAAINAYRADPLVQWISIWEPEL